jgi:hypothetical protein
VTHLTPAELRQWYGEGAADDRQRVLTHLAACDECRRALAELARNEVGVGPAPLDPQDFVIRGRDAYTDARSRPWRWRPVVIVGAAAASAAVLAVLVTPALRQARQNGDRSQSETRGGDLRLLEPVGDVCRPAEFRWTSPVSASRYRVVVYDSARRAIYTGVANVERLPFDSDLRARLAPGEYTWSVDALDAGGTAIVNSDRRAFRIARC